MVFELPWVTRGGSADRDRKGYNHVNRRRLLQIGGAGIATGLAGCSSGLTQERTYRASWVSLATDGRPPGIEFVDDEEVETTRTEELSDLTVEATIVSHVASYDHTDDGAKPFLQEGSVGLVSTPVAEEAGKKLNPAATESIGELLTGDVGEQFLRQIDVDSGWRDGPQRLRETADEMLGTATTVETYSGTTEDDEFVLLHATRVVVEGGVVLVGEAWTRPASEGTAADAGTVDEAIELFRPLLALVVRQRDDASGGTSTTDEPAMSAPGRVPMEEVPTDIRRRAARLLEESHGTPVEWEETPSLGDYAHEVGRPDLDGVAYYELAVEPQGFVVASTGPHDAPLPHWNSDGETMGVRLEEEGEGELGRLVWIDRLRYVAETPEGGKMAARGNPVPRLHGLEALMELDEEGPRRVRYGPPEELRDAEDDDVDEGYEPELLVAENDFELPEEFSFGRWESYGELLEEYDEVYGPLLDDLAERAAEAWEEMEANVGALDADGTRREPLFDGEAVGAVGGVAAAAVDVTRRTRAGTHDVLELTPTEDVTTGDDLEVEVVRDGSRERLTFHVEDDAGFDAGRTDWVGDTATTAQTDWAGGFRLQPKYHQYDYQGCAVGCGPVAWALLFGWGDKQAHGGKYNSTWWPRYGLYLDEGGRWSNGNAKAPDYNHQNNDGPKNVMEELNRHVDVFCLGSSGATHPKDMDEAKGYLRGRTYTNIEDHHSWTGRPIKRARTETRHSIRGGNPNREPTPVVVGKGWLSHYPMAYAYKSMFWHPDKVKVNNGWGDHNRTGGDANEWIWAQTWFSGEIYP